jgi:hypothetical protein
MGFCPVNKSLNWLAIGPAAALRWPQQVALENAAIAGGEDDV